MSAIQLGIGYTVSSSAWAEDSFLGAVYKSGTGTRGRGHRDACVGTWDLGTRDKGLGDVKYGTRGRGDVKNWDAGNPGC